MMIMIIMIIMMMMMMTMMPLQSGVVAAEAVYDLLTQDPAKTVAAGGAIDAQEGAKEASAYQQGMEKSWVRRYHHYHR
jgi:LPS sulfotransferase NodH